MKNILLVWIFTGLCHATTSQGLAEMIQSHANFGVSLKVPGNPAMVHSLQQMPDGTLVTADEKFPLKLSAKMEEKGEGVDIYLTISASKDSYFNVNGQLFLPGLNYDTSYMYLPGFWYRKNLRSPKNAPSARVSRNWLVREDRLSTPMAGAYDLQRRESYSLFRIDAIKKIALTTHSQGEVILSGPSDLGALGFGEEAGETYLSFSFPYAEAPYSYIRKLTLGPPVSAFAFIAEGESRTLRYRLVKDKAENYAEYVASAWSRSYDLLQPQALENQKFTNDEIKATLTHFFRSSVVDTGNLKGFSGVHLQTETCAPRPILEIGFIGRVLLNAFNALEYAEQNGDKELKNIAQAVFNSYEENGFSPEGFLREYVDEEKKEESRVYSIRRQSEGIYAVLHYLQYEKKQGRIHEVFERKIKNLLDILVGLQQVDGSFPRKFDHTTKLVDDTGGSSPSAVLPLAMAYHYFNDKAYLASARNVALYEEKEIISKSDYFSSTLDADCEDKEASLYAATALYYLSQVTKGKEREKYVSLAKQAAYFTLSWYYTWDVPFARGQMLGDIGLKSRGWGNVSVENNHIDVFIFEFDEVLQWLSDETGEARFKDFAGVIRSSMREQLLPHTGHMMGIGKVGYYPEVVQHTAWDYGKNGKGYYNDIFAPGWTVASLWELLTDNRTKAFFGKQALN